MAPVPFGSLIPARSRVLPQGGAILGQLTGTFQQGLAQGRQRAAEDDAPRVLFDYLDTLGQGQGTLGNIAPATGYVGGPQAPQRDPAMVPGSPTFNGGTALRQARQDADAGIPQPPPVSADYAASIAGYGSGLNTTGLDAQFGGSLNTAIQGYIAAGGNPADIQINSLVRSTEEQQRLYDQYQRGEIGLAAPPGQSRHEYGAAADIQSGPFLDWLHQNAGQYGLSFLTGSNFTNDPGHVQLAGPSPAGTRAPAIPAGAMPSTGGGYSAQPAWSPPVGAERQALRAMIMNPVTRDMGIQLATQRMTPPAPVQPNWQLQEFNGTLYRIDANTGQAQPVIQGQPNPGDREMREDANGILRYVDTQEPVFPAVQPTPEPAEPPRTEQILMPDGNVYIMGFNPATGQFDQKIGLADPGGQFSVAVGPDGAVQVTQGRQGAQTDPEAVRAAQVGQANLVLNNIDRAFGLAEQGWTTGFMGARTRGIEGTAAFDLAQTVDTIKANIGFAQLAQMRASSPTGAALGAITERELAFLQSVLGSLETAQSRPQFTENLRAVQGAYLDIVHGEGKWAVAQDGQILIVGHTTAFDANGNGLVWTADGWAPLQGAR